MVQLSHLYLNIGKNKVFITQPFVGEVIYVLFNTQSRFVISFLPRSKYLLISWLKSLSVVNLEPKKIKYVTVYTLPLLHDAMMGQDAMIICIIASNAIHFFNVEFQASFFTLLFYPHQEALPFLLFPPLEWYHLHN